MLMVSYDSRILDDIHERLFYLTQMGQKVIRMNISNIISRYVYITDILNEYPDIQILGIGVGVPDTVFEPGPKDLVDRSQKFYYSKIPTIILHFSPYSSPNIEFPKSLKELVIDTSPAVTDGLSLGTYLHKIIKKSCRPALKIVNTDGIRDWSGFSVPNEIRKISFNKRRNIDPVLRNILSEAGFIRTERTESEVVYEKETPKHEEHTRTGERGD